MYLLCMIKARIRWCTCRVENILTLGKLLSLWFCFLLHSILFLISQISYGTYKIISSYELARPIMGTIFLVNREPHVKTTAQAWGRCASQFQVLNVLCYIETMFLFTNKFVQMTIIFVF